MMRLRVVPAVPSRRPRPPLAARGRVQPAAVLRRPTTEPWSRCHLLCLSPAPPTGAALLGFARSTAANPSPPSCSVAGQGARSKGWRVDQNPTGRPQVCPGTGSSRGLPPGSGLPHCARPPQHRLRGNGARCLAAAAGTSSALVLLAGAASITTTNDAIKVFSVPSFFSSVAVACEAAKNHSTEATSQGSAGAHPDSDATTKRAAEHPSNEDKGSTAESLKHYTWSFVNGSWLLKPVTSLLASAGISPSKGGEVDSKTMPHEARKATGTNYEEFSGPHANQSAARTPPKTEEEDLAASPSASVKEKVDELVAAIREKFAAAPAQSAQHMGKPQSSPAGQAGFDSEEASARQPSQLPAPAASSHAAASVSKLVEELTLLLSRNMPDTCELPSMSDLSPSKLVEVVQTSVVTKKIEELTEAIRAENAILTLSEYILGHENILEVIKRNQSSEDLHPEILWDASVRAGRDLSEGERGFLTARKAVLRESLRKYLELPDSAEIHDDDIPVVAVSGSGGGYRAMVSMLGSMVALDHSGFLDVSTYIGCVSGSAWAVAQLYSIPTKSTAATKVQSGGELDFALRPETPSSSSPSEPIDPSAALAAGSSSTTENLSRLIDHVTNSIQYSPTSPQTAIQLLRRMNPDFLFGGLVSKQSSGGEISIVDAFGTLLSMRLMGSVATAMVDAAREGHAAAAAEEKDGEAGPTAGEQCSRPQDASREDVREMVDVRFGLSKQKKAIKNGERPMPIYTAARHEHPGVEGGKVDRWELWEFSPYEVGCAEFGAFIPSWAFGRPFSAGRSTARLPETSLSLLLGMFGSAFCANAAQAYDEFRSLLPPVWTAQTDGIFAEFNKAAAIPLVTPSGWHNPFKGMDPRKLPERLPAHDPPRTRFLAAVKDHDAEAERANGGEKAVGEAGNAPFGEGAVTPVVTITRNGQRVDKSVPSRPTKADDVDSLCEADGVYLMDAGLLNNLSVPSLIRPERQVDVMVIIDSSSDITEHDYLERTASYAKRLGRRVGIPEIPDWDGRGKLNVVVWEPAQDEVLAAADTGEDIDWTTTSPEVIVEGRPGTKPPDPGCTVVYVPLIKNEGYDQEFDPQTADFCSTFNFAYHPEQTSKLLGLAKRNVEDAQLSLKKAVRQAYEKRRRSRLEKELVRTGEWLAM